MRFTVEDWQSTTHRPVFKRYSVLQVLEEILNDKDSGDEDVGGQNESDLEEESDTNEHHPLWFYMLLCVSMFRTFLLKNCL